MRGESAVTHYKDVDLILYYYGEARWRRGRIERHLQTCASCEAAYRGIVATLEMVVAPEVPARGDQYGLEVWQRIRGRLPERETSSWMAWVRPQHLGLAAAALVIAAFVAGRLWPRESVTAPTVATRPPTEAGGGNAGPAKSDASDRILLTAVAEHLDRSGRVLTEIVNTPEGGDIAAEQQWADDLLAASRLYRQDAIDAGERSVASVLDDLERSLVEIVHSPSKISAADLEQIRQRIDAAALLFKVHVMSEELRRRELPVSQPRRQAT
jgi:hypothetical protein